MSDCANKVSQSKGVGKGGVGGGEMSATVKPVQVNALWAVSVVNVSCGECWTALAAVLLDGR